MAAILGAYITKGLGVRKKNGDEYEPSSVWAFLQSIDRHLGKCKYGFSILNDKEFFEVRDILQKKMKQLKSIGKGIGQTPEKRIRTKKCNSFKSLESWELTLREL